MRTVTVIEEFRDAQESTFGVKDRQCRSSDLFHSLRTTKVAWWWCDVAAQSLYSKLISVVSGFRGRSQALGLGRRHQNSLELLFVLIACHLREFPNIRSSFFVSLCMLLLPPYTEYAQTSPTCWRNRAHLRDCSRGISSIFTLRACCLRVVNKTQKLSIMFAGDGGNVCMISLLLSWVRMMQLLARRRRCSSRRTLLRDDSLVNQAPTLQEHACRLADVLIGRVLSAVPKFAFAGLDMTMLSRTQDIRNTSTPCCPPCHTSAARQPRPLQLRPVLCKSAAPGYSRTLQRSVCLTSACVGVT